MISTRRIVAAVGLAVGVTGLAVPSATAATTPETGKVNPIAMLDSLAVSDLPAEHKAQMPRVSDQLDKLNELNGLYQLEQLHQVTDLAAPAMGLVGAFE
ncbi:hypothetical protein AB0H92_47620 [Streptomyces phaeochromogenes]|uniref:Secreted protein n=2 Tax=Streptomyces TaxID=1883 RepID=A0A7T7I197_9ACTN|nr:MULTISPECIES: hypothetical protein [Streptomyces]QQM39112.1 hypothetical protein JEQ17_06270 [Streptomyces liliifuscus]WRZ27312.1 hypothetical protein OG931_05900 [Streptomyces phaeochromogenes]WSD12875.1 hypothetical protein OHB35_06305 [Streptomyces phaeochromogenes]WSJ10329.1 hypothetical protein OG437_45255 [Streptomyces phaeochromogenes]WSS91624.1 hypothetical protein OG478_07490 [Streptomyces phaeochromogenes]